jgi:dienelactone hydrolase
MRSAVAAVVLAIALVARAEDPPDPTPKAVKEVKVRTEDGLVLAADLSEPSGGGEGKPAVVALHAEGGDRSMWKETAARFASHGYSFLAVDLRGHGGSKVQKGTDPKPDDPGTDLSPRVAARDPQLFSAMSRDVSASVKYLRATLLCDGAQISVVGCGACGAAGLEAVGRDAKVAAALWIGPAPNNFGAGALEALRKWDGRPIGLMTTDRNGRTDFDNIARSLAKQPRVELIVVPGPAAAAGEVVAKAETAKDEVFQFVRGWIERPKFTGKTRPEDHGTNGPDHVVVGQSMESGGFEAGGLSFTGNEAPPEMEGVVVLACADGAATKIPAGARRLTFKPAKGPEPCVDVLIEQWSGTGWSRLESRVVHGCGSIVLSKDVNTWELWVSPRMLGVKPSGPLAYAKARIVKGKPNWSGDRSVPIPGMGKMKLDGDEKVDPANPSTWEKTTLR